MSCTFCCNTSCCFDSHSGCGCGHNSCNRHDRCCGCGSCNRCGCGFCNKCRKKDKFCRGEFTSNVTCCSNPCSTRTAFARTDIFGVATFNLPEGQYFFRCECVPNFLNPSKAEYCVGLNALNCGDDLLFPCSLVSGNANVSNLNTTNFVQNQNTTQAIMDRYGPLINNGSNSLDGTLPNINTQTDPNIPTQNINTTQYGVQDISNPQGIARQYSQVINNARNTVRSDNQNLLNIQSARPASNPSSNNQQNQNAVVQQQTSQATQTQNSSQTLPTEQSQTRPSNPPNRPPNPQGARPSSARAYPPTVQKPPGQK